MYFFTTHFWNKTKLPKNFEKSLKRTYIHLYLVYLFVFIILCYKFPVLYQKEFFAIGNILCILFWIVSMIAGNILYVKRNKGNE